MNYKFITVFRIQQLLLNAVLYSERKEKANIQSNSKVLRRRLNTQSSIGILQALMESHLRSKAESKAVPTKKKMWRPTTHLFSEKPVSEPSHLRNDTPAAEEVQLDSVVGW